jgi:hypothetical protein
MASDQALALMTEAEALARRDAMCLAYEQAMDVAGMALRQYVAADLDLLTVRRIQRQRQQTPEDARADRVPVIVHQAGQQLAGLMLGDREVLYG